MDVRDVIEREVTTPPQPPQAPEQKSSSNFERKRWTSKRTVKNSLSSTKDKGNNSLKSTLSRQTPLSEKEEIHLENVQKLYTMSSEQIEKEREELFRTMDPNILAGLLRRMEKAEIDIGIGPQRGTTVDGFEGSRENRDEKLEQDFLLVGDQQDKCATKEGREEEEEKEEKEEKKEKKEKEEKEEKDQMQKIETGNQTATNTVSGNIILVKQVSLYDN